MESQDNTPQDELPPNRCRHRRTRLAARREVLTNADLEKMVDTNDEWIRTRTGISPNGSILKDPNQGDLRHGGRGHHRPVQAQRGISPDSRSIW